MKGKLYSFIKVLLANQWQRVPRVLLLEAPDWVGWGSGAGFKFGSEAQVLAIETQW